MMDLIVLTIALALLFDFVNGFHDSANAISTIVATKVLSPIQAVAMAAIGNLIGPLFFTTAVASTIGKGIIDSDTLQKVLPAETFVVLILAAVLGALAWDLITWYAGLPTSSSHALIGGLIGAGISAGGTSILVLSGIYKVLLFMIISPVIGFIAAFLFALIIMRIFHERNSHRMNNHFRKLQIFSAFFYSLTHGTNDAQKTMGVITLLLVIGGFLTTFDVPIWVIFAAHISISLGTFFGGWRIVKTMAHKITNLKPYQGFCAETAGGIVLANMAHLGIPVSTTHAISGSIMGVGATHGPRFVRWGIARRIVAAWIFTIPASAIMSWLFFIILSVFI